MKTLTREQQQANKCKFLILGKWDDLRLILTLFRSVYISYGGLLMCLEGDYRHLQNLTVGENIYLLMRK